MNYINNFKFFPKQDQNSPLLKIDGKTYWYMKTEVVNPQFTGQYILYSKVHLKSMNLMYKNILIEQKIGMFD